MTKELRKKFILINMALVGTVLLIVFAVLCFQNYQRLEQDSMRVMERYFNDNGARPVPELEFDKKREWRNFPLMLSFCAVVDSNGELVSYQSDNLTVSEATVSQAVEAALDKMESSGKNSGTLSGLDLRYLARGQQGQMWIAFVDRTQEYASMRSFLTSALQLGAAGLIALFLISFFLSAWVVRPVERSWAQQRQFVADASHELKTPLTVILANTGILLSHPDDRIERGHGFLKDHADVAPPHAFHRGFGQFGKIAAFKEDAPGGEAPRFGDEAEQGQRRHALAATGFPHKAERAPRMQRERHVAHHVERAFAGVEPHGDAFRLQQRGGGGRDWGRCVCGKGHGALRRKLRIKKV